MQAVGAAYGIGMSPPEMALLCQRVENLVAGAPCGVMDQMTSACGEADRLLRLLCQPWELKGSVRLPEELEVLIGGQREAQAEPSLDRLHLVRLAEPLPPVVEVAVEPAVLPDELCLPVV